MLCYVVLRLFDWRVGVRGRAKIVYLMARDANKAFSYHAGVCQKSESEQTFDTIQVNS